jgi:hypothetical protein
LDARSAHYSSHCPLISNDLTSRLGRPPSREEVGVLTGLDSSASGRKRSPTGDDLDFDALVIPSLMLRLANISSNTAYWDDRRERALVGTSLRVDHPGMSLRMDFPAGSPSVPSHPSLNDDDSEIQYPPSVEVRAPQSLQKSRGGSHRRDYGSREFL